MATTDVPRPEHPRPDRRRERWATLNGTWELGFDEPTFDREIVVPFAFQSPASGIGTADVHETLWYLRRFTSPSIAPGERLLVHFGAVDFAATVWVDGTEVGAHRGGHTSFTCDVTHALTPGADDHELVVKAVDEYRSDQLRGKQTATFPYLVHYTPTSGIWQPVWLEVTGPAWIDELCVVADADGSLAATADVRGDGAVALRLTVDGDGGPVVLEGAESAAGRVDGVRPWSPSDPASTTCARSCSTTRARWSTPCTATWGSAPWPWTATVGSSTVHRCSSASCSTRACGPSRCSPRRPRRPSSRTSAS